MLHMSRKTRWNILLYLLAVLVTELLYIYCPLPHISGVLYGGFVITWGLTVRRRIVHREIRRFLAAGAAALLALFILRFCRWEAFAWWTGAYRFLWYAYYVPFTLVPLLSLLAALWVGKTELDRPPRREGLLWWVWALLAAAILTNDFHSLAFRLADPAEAGTRYAYGGVYYFAILWCALLSVSAFAVLLRRCRLAQYRRLWCIPTLAAAFGGALVLLYYLEGGDAPVLGGVKLYNLQEAYAALFIGLWESCIQIGLIPSNTGYEDLFQVSRSGAVLTDRVGTVVYRAGNYDESAGGPYTLRRERPIHGGKVAWSEDHASIHALNEAIRRAAQVLEEENDLIEQENLIRAEKAHYEAQNRLYDRIASVVRPQLDAIDDALTNLPGEGEGPRERLLYICILGAYVKRRANLELLADGREELPAEELFYAMGESLEYLTLSGLLCELRPGSAGPVPSALALAAYGVFEEVVEWAYPLCHTVSVTARAEGFFFLEIALDTEEPCPIAERMGEGLEALGYGLTVSVTDETTYVRLAGREGARP